MALTHLLLSDLARGVSTVTRQQDGRRSLDAPHQPLLGLTDAQADVLQL